MNNGDVVPLLKEIIKWQRLQGESILRDMTKKNNLFSDKSEKVVYLNSDGEKSSRELGKMAKISHMKVQSLWKQWIELGIAEPTEKYSGGRCRRIFDLKDFGVR